MAGQTGKNIAVHVAVQATTAVVATVSTAAVALRIKPSPGLDLQRRVVPTEEFRKDGMTLLPGLGAQTVTGSYESELSVTSFNDFLGAIVRSTLVSSLVAATGVTLITVTGAQSYITTAGATAGSGAAADGFKVGDVFRITGAGAVATANASNYRITALATNTITVAETLATGAATTLLSTSTMTRLLKWTPGTVPVRKQFTIEEYLQDIDANEVFRDCRVTGLRVSWGPNSKVGLTWTLMGTTVTTNLAGSSSAPWFQGTITEYTTENLTGVDAVIRVAGADVATLTGGEATFELGGSTADVVGAGGISPDVYEGDLRISGNVTGLRTDLAYAALASAGTQFEMVWTFKGSSGTPSAYVSFFFPVCRFDNATAPLGADGPQVETLAFSAGKKAAATAYDEAMVTIQASA